MRIGVIGLGAIGGVVAQRLLAHDSADRIVLAAGHRARDLRGAFSAEVHEQLPLLDAPYDLVLLCTRTDATLVALPPAAQMLARDGAVVCLQNGLPEEPASLIAGADRVLGAVIGWSASYVPPHAWTVTGGGKFTLGAASPPAAAKLPRAKKVLERAFPVRVTRNLAGARWTKLAMNCAMSTLGAVTGLDLGGLADRHDARSIAIGVVGEAAAVARAKGVRLERVAGLDLAWISRDSKVAHGLIWLAAQRRPRQKSGMLVRLEEGRPAGQIDDLNGVVARAARQVGLRAPLNEQLVDLVHAIERGEARIGTHNLSALR